MQSILPLFILNGRPQTRRSFDASSVSRPSPVVVDPDVVPRVERLNQHIVTYGPLCKPAEGFLGLHWLFQRSQECSSIFSFTSSAVAVAVAVADAVAVAVASPATASAMYSAPNFSVKHQCFHER